MINNAMNGNDSSMIRNITRGIIENTNFGAGTTVDIPCTITNVDKVIVLLNGSVGNNYDSGVYLVDITTTGIEVTRVTSIKTSFSYQIIEFV